MTNFNTETLEELDPEQLSRLRVEKGLQRRNSLGAAALDDGGDVSIPDDKKLKVQLRKQIKKLEKGLRTPANPTEVPSPPYEGPPVRAGFDAEWVTWPGQAGDGPWNEVLCITMVIDCGGRRSRYLFRPEGPGRDHRPTLSGFIQSALRRAMKEGVVPSMPNEILVFGHFMRGDLATFRDFWAYKRQFRGLGKTVVTGREGVSLDLSADDTGTDLGAHQVWSGNDERLHLRALDGQRWRVRVRFIDTIKLTPGQKGLGYAGELIGNKKLDLHDDLGVPRVATDERPEREGWGVPAVYGIGRMDLVMRDYAYACAEYNFHDAEVTLDYGLFMERFALDELGLSRLPPTIAGCASGLIRRLAGEQDALHGLIGRTTTTRVYFHEGKRQYRTRKSNDLVAGLGLFYTFASKFYHGGRNECFYHGPTAVGHWYDYDLPGAYTTALVGLRAVDYDNIRQELDPDAYGIDDMGLAWVTFEFPDSTRFPCIPVRGPSEALFFPLRGTKEDNVFVGAPEIFLARRMGAKVKVIQGFKAPWRSDDRIFEPFTRLVQEKRKEYPKAQHPGLHALWKEVGNSGYGLTAQGLREKRVFDPETMRGQMIGPSPLTEPFLAAWVTSYIRAVLGEILAGVPDAATVVSATTDGLLLDTHMDDLQLDGPLCSHYADLRERLFGKREVLDAVPKHGARQIVSVAVRTTFTAVPEPELTPVCAKGSVKPPCKPSAHNRHMLRLYLGLRPGQTVEHEQLISAREQLTREADLHAIKRARNLNLTYDFKRRPTDARMVRLGRHRERVAWDTVPWDTAQEAEFARTRVDGWRRDRKRVFKTLDDYGDWYEYHEASVAVREAGDAVGRRPMPVRADNAVGVLKRLFLQAGRLGQWGVQFERGDATRIAEVLTDAGFPTGKEDVTYAARRKGGLIPHSVAVTPRTVQMLKILLRAWPTFDFERAFREKDLPGLRKLLSATAAGGAQV